MLASAAGDTASTDRERLAAEGIVSRGLDLMIGLVTSRAELRQSLPLTAIPTGMVSFRAVRPRRPGDEGEAITLTVAELWHPGADPFGDRRLVYEGCFLSTLSWHIQVGESTGPRGAERLDIVSDPDDRHPRIHRHPYGRPNEVREPAELPPPDAWLYAVDRASGGLLADDLDTWDPDEQE
jgi:hypothetical protein